MAEKLFYSMGEVAEMFDVNASLIRHWESQFSVIRPKRNKKASKRLRKPRRKKEEPEHKELFAFYEQSLF